MAEKWRKNDTLASFLKREKIKGAREQLAHERQVTRDMKAAAAAKKSGKK